jgi:hypothetical protein
VGPCLLTERLAAQRYCDFRKPVLPELPEEVPLSVRQKSWFQDDVAPGQSGSGCTRHIQEGGLGVQSWLHGLLGRQIQVRWIFFLWGNLKEHVYWESPRTIEVLAARLKPTPEFHGVLDTTQSGELPSTLKWMEAASDTATTRRPWFDHSTECAILQWSVSWRLDETGHVLCSILDLLFNKESYCEIVVRDFCFRFTLIYIHT